MEPFLKPDWSTPRLTLADSQQMCAQIELTPIVEIPTAARSVVETLRKTHDNGNAFFAGIKIGPDVMFDRFASRNNLLTHSTLPRLMHRKEFQDLLPELQILDSPPEENLEAFQSQLVRDGSYTFESLLAWTLYDGGAYHKPFGDGRMEKELSTTLCEALFQLRFAGVEYFKTHHPWTPWFFDVAWDWISILIDLRRRAMWVLVLTDTD